MNEPFLRSAVRTTALAIVTAGALAGCARYAADASKRAGTVQSIAGRAGALVVDDGGRGGTPVVFLHSYAGSKAHWSAQLQHLRRTRRALAVDLRGHGASAPPADNVYASEALATDVAAVVDALRLERFVLVGHSMGGAAAIAYAGAHPQRVAGLVLVGAPGRVPPEQASKITAALHADYDKVMQDYWNQLLTGARPDVHAQLSAEKQSIPKQASLSIIEALFADDPAPALRRYPGPTLAIVTSHNNQPYDLHRLLPQLPNTLIAGTSHWPHLDKPEAFDRVLDDFLATVK